MRKSFLNALLESCVACDPIVYMYWRTALMETEAQARPEPQLSRSREGSGARLKLVRGGSRVSA